jgi:hypothetical protein
MKQLRHFIISSLHSRNILLSILQISLIISSMFVMAVPAERIYAISKFPFAFVSEEDISRASIIKNGIFSVTRVVTDKPGKDTTPPVVSIDSPSDGEVVSGNV